MYKNAKMKCDLTHTHTHTHAQTHAQCFHNRIIKTGQNHPVLSKFQIYGYKLTWRAGTWNLKPWVI